MAKNIFLLKKKKLYFTIFFAIKTDKKFKKKD